MAVKKFYITTTAPYVNADPHIGFALEIVQADVIARFKRLLGFEVAFGFGTDEHGLKIYRKALEEKKDPQEYCDENAKKFDGLKKILHLSSTHFIRTTDSNHLEAAQEFWRRCYKNGDIYKKKYRIKYCVGCELEKTDSELEGNRCPVHPNLKIESYNEENYFFRFSKYQEKLLALYKNNKDFVFPKHRLSEIESFVKKGLQDFSISRLKAKMPWGVDVPNDADHVMYVWFDALIFYISTLGWPINLREFNRWWPGVQVAGKDNLRQQSAIWQAMLMSAGLPNSQQIFIHGFITSEGQKMSKSLGNVIDPVALVNQYGTDAVRYYLLKEIPPSADGDFSHSRMREIYTADLANELGNLVSRTTNLAEKYSISGQKLSSAEISKALTDISVLLNGFRFNEALVFIWNLVKNTNKHLDEKAPWKNTPHRTEIIRETLHSLAKIGLMLTPFLPKTAEKISKAAQGKIKKIQPLFPRLK